MSVRKVAKLNYNMTTADSNSVDGVIPFGRQFDFIGDVETELMILTNLYVLAIRMSSCMKMHM